MNPELRSLVLTTAVRENNDRATFEELIGRYRDTASPEIQGDIAAAITSAKDSSLIGLILEYIMDASIIRPQDVGHWFVYTLRNRHGRTLAWNWLRDNWAWIEKTFKTDKSYDYYPRYIASSLVTRKELQQYRSFFAPLKADPGLTRVITVGDSELEARVELIERDAPAVIDALHRL
jgi:aminopeptidase N